MTILTANDCVKLFGDPAKELWTSVLNVPGDLRFGPIPERIYMHRYMHEPFLNGLKNVKERGITGEVKTWAGCFSEPRSIRGGTSTSLHSWGIAFDMNASTNKLGAKPTMSEGLVKCFTDTGFEWGGKWSRPDGMHFQLTLETVNRAKVKV